KTHATIARVSGAIGRDFHYNVGVSALMELSNEIARLPAADRSSDRGRAALSFAIESMLKLLAPYAPHIAEELWEALGHEDGILVAGWPLFAEEALARDTVEVVVQVNGK